VKKWAGNSGGDEIIWLTIVSSREFGPSSRLRAAVKFPTGRTGIEYALDTFTGSFQMHIAIAASDQLAEGFQSVRERVVAMKFLSGRPGCKLQH
jgi:hypothetical protein